MTTCIDSSDAQYLEYYNRIEAQMEELRQRYRDDKINYKYFIKEGYEAMSKFVHICEDRGWNNNEGYRKIAKLCWEYGYL